MELVLKAPIFHDAYGTMYAGNTTENRGLTEEYKQMLLESFPGYFELYVAPAEPADAPVIETPEGNLVIETPEDGLPRTRKK